MPLSPEEQQEFEGVKTTHTGLAADERREFADMQRERAETERLRQLEILKPLTETIREIPKVGFKQTAVRPFQIWKEEADSGLQTMGEAIKQHSVLGLMGGAVQYGSSPLTGFGKAWLGEPGEYGAESMGAPPWASQMIGQTAEELPWILLPHYIAKTMAQATPLGFQTFKKFRKMKLPEVPLEVAKIKPGFREWSQKIFQRQKIDKFRNIPGFSKWLDEKGFAGKQIDSEQLEKLWGMYIKQIPKEGELFQEIVREGLINDITKVFEKVGEGKLKEGRRLFRDIQEAIEVEDIYLEELPRILDKTNLTQVEAATLYANTVSTGARIMAYHSRTARRLNKVFAGNKEALDILNRSIIKESKKGIYFSDKLFEIWSKLDSPRRAIMVSQLATAMRNAWSQAGRISIGTFDSTLQSYLKGNNPTVAMKESVNTLTAFFNRLKPAKRKMLVDILESEAGIVQGSRLLSQPVHEITVGGRVSDIVMKLNRVQEYFFRRLAFEAKLRSALQDKGWQALEKIDVSQLRGKRLQQFQEMMEESVNYGLEMTFAASPKGKIARSLIRNFSRTPFTTIQPFPRFAYANALPFIINHSPMGFARLLSPRNLRALAAGNPTEFAKVASQATIGTLLFESAWHIRQSDYAGEKWYQIKKGTYDPKTGDAEYWDVRAYAPLSTYLFIADLFIHPERIKGTDVAEAAVGLNRIAGSGLVLVDLIRAQRGETAAKFLKRFLGQFLGSYTVTARMGKDIYGGLEELFSPTGMSEETIIRDTRLNPEIGPILDNIPKIAEYLPEAISPINTKRMRRINPLLRQLTGLTVTSKNRMRQEIDKLGLSYSVIYPRTGLPLVDREWAKHMGPLVEKTSPIFLFNNPIYTKASLVKKRVLASWFFQIVRQEAMKSLPAQMQQVAKAKRFPNYVKDLIEETWEMPFDEIIKRMQDAGKKHRKEQKQSAATMPTR